MNPICIVDDQQQICTTVSDILRDEGYEVCEFQDAESFWLSLDHQTPSLILLDIWLPGTDGLDILKRLHKRFPELPVIMMSGHAGIETAVSSIKAGAFDFLEKPINLDTLLEKIETALQQHLVENHHTSSEKTTVQGLQAKQSQGNAVQIVEEQTPQRTLGKDVVLNGVGLLSGEKTGIILSPLGTNEGVLFQTLDGQKIPGHITFLENYSRTNQSKVFSANSTVLKNGSQQIRTVEHLLATFAVYGITNVLVKVDREIPNIDGSAKKFDEMITEAGIVEQESPATVAVIKEKISIGEENNKEKYIYAEPFDGFEIRMRVDYPAPIGEQKYTFSPRQDSFSKEIAPARSFNTFENIELAQRLGKVGGGYLNSHIIMHEGRVINTELRYPDEFVRHKILDLIGDLYLLGLPVRGRIVANMTSHGFNQALVQLLYNAIQNNR